MNVFLLVVKCFISMSSSVDCLQLILIYVLIASNCHCNLVPGSLASCPTKDLVEIPVNEKKETIAINYTNKKDVEKTGFHFTVKMPDIMFDTGLPRCTIAEMKFYWNPYCGQLGLKLAYVHTTGNWSCTFYDYDPDNLGQVKEHLFSFKQNFTIGNWGNRAEITADGTSDTEPFTYDCKDFVTEPIVGFHPIIGHINDKRNQLNFVYEVGELDRNCGIVITLIKKNEVNLNYTVDDCSTTISTTSSQQPTSHLTEHSLGNFSETPFIPITDAETPNEDSDENSASRGISIPWIIGIVFVCLFLAVIVVIVIIVLLRWRLHLKSREDMKDVENGNEQESDQSNSEEEEGSDKEDTEEEESE